MTDQQAAWTIEWYQTQSGGRPIARFLAGLDGRDRDEAAALLKLLREWGNQMLEPRSQALGGGLFELRGHQIRMFYVFRPGHRVVVLDGVIKKQDKIPATVLKLVRSYQRDLERRDRVQRQGP